MIVATIDYIVLMYKRVIVFIVDVIIVNFDITIFISIVVNYCK